MMVKVKIELQSRAETSDREEMFCAAKTLTNTPDSITITQPKSKDSVLIATFTIHKARQIDVVDNIAKSFSDTMKNYGQPSISFPKDRKSKKVNKTSDNYTPKQRQYLSFIYYYKKLNSVSPAEADFLKYFKTSPSSVHSMILNLEKKGLIKRKSGISRSIELLLSRSEIPDLD